MKILILSTKYTHDNNCPWLVSELANAFAELGHQVTVINTQWSGATIEPKSLNENIQLYKFKAGFVGHESKFAVPLRWMLSFFASFKVLISEYCKGSRFDLMIGFSPCSALHLSTPLATHLSKKSYLIYWDFFPIHNSQISKKIPKFIVPALWHLEKYLVNLYNRVGLMSNANKDFFIKYFKYKNTVNLDILPIWTEIDNSSKVKISDDYVNLKDDNIYFIYGGQLVDGRGIIPFCECFIEANKINNKVKLLICGEGHLAYKVREFEASHPDSVKYLGFLNRSTYVDLVSRCDVGVIITDSSVSSPTFPSKSLDYFKSKIPILAVLEEASDFGKVLEENNAGLSCTADDKNQIISLIFKFAQDGKIRERMGENGFNYLLNTHDVKKIVTIITGDMNEIL